MLGAIVFGILMGAIAGIMGLLYAKLWDQVFVPDFSEDMDDEDQILAEWVKAYMKRENRKIGFYYVYQWDLKETWHKIWYFQFMKYFKINILKYRTQKGKHIVDD